MPANLENSAAATGLEKVSFHSSSKKGDAKECSNYCTISLISHVSEVMPQILQARLQQYVNPELPDVQAGFRKGWFNSSQLINVIHHIVNSNVKQKNHMVISKRCRKSI